MVTIRNRRRFASLRLAASAPVLAAAGIPASLMATGTAAAQEASPVSASLLSLDPALAVTGAAVAFAAAAGAWALRVSLAARNATVDWSRRLARTEAQAETSNSVLSSHPGLVLVWDDTEEDLEEGWGHPLVLGGPAALASLLAMAGKGQADFRHPAASLLTYLGDLPIEAEEGRATAPTLAEKIQNLRAHGVAFSGAVLTEDARPIECDGRVAGSQVTLWLTDPVVRHAEELGVMGAARDRNADLHGALHQLDRAPIVAWRRGPDLRIEWANQAYVELVEAINLAEVIDAQIEIDPACRQLAERTREEVERSGRRGGDAIIPVGVKGQRRVLRVIEMPMHSSQGKSSFGGMAIDITRQERAQNELKRQESAHQRTLDQLSSAVAVFDASQGLEYANNAFLAVWGLTERDLRGRPSHGEILDQLRHLERLPAKSDFGAWKQRQLALYTENAADGRDAAEGEVPAELWDLPDGRTFRVQQQRNAMGGVSVVFEDISDELRMQSRYQTELAVRRTTLNTLAQGVAVFGPDGLLKLHNRAFEELWELSRGDFGDQVHWHRLEAHMAERSKVAEEGFTELKRHVISFASEDRKAHAEEIVLDNDRILVAATAPLPDGATLLTFQDVTDSRAHARSLEHRNKVLEDAHLIKRRFVNHMSYQLRDPLNSIGGFLQMLEAETVGPLNVKQKDYMASVMTASNSLLELVDAILDLAAIDANRMLLEREPVEVKALIDNIGSLAALTAADSEVTLEIECADDIGTLEADEKRLQQILQNLLHNAFSFTDAGGTVTLGAERHEDRVEIFVKDTGRGFETGEMASPFGWFESAGPNSGAGLGLALVESLVRLHGGTVEIDSAPGTGTRVVCALPLRQAEADDTGEEGSAPDGKPDADDFAGADGLPDPVAARALMELTEGAAAEDAADDDDHDAAAPAAKVGNG